MFTITKIKGGYKVGRRYPQENSIRVVKVNSLDTYEKMLKGDKMGLASFNRARKMAKEKAAKAGKVNSIDVPQSDETKPEAAKEQPKAKAKK